MEPDSYGRPSGKIGKFNTFKLYYCFMLRKIPLIIAVFILLILIPISIISFDKEFYFSEFAKYGIYDKFERDINSEIAKVIDYINNKGEIESDFFNDKEKEHLKDVRNLFNISKFLIVLCIIIIGVNYYFLRKRGFLDGLNKGAVLTIIFIFILFITILINFNLGFIIFHKLMFENNLWLLNPAEDNLIVLLPEEIFFDIAIRAFSLSFISALVIILFKKSLNSQI